MRIQQILLIALMASMTVIKVARAEEEETKADVDTAVMRSSLSNDAAPSCFGACRINFQKELNVSLDYLDSIGQRIHDARKSPDPVDLALAARGLAVAEQVADSKASITSDQVMAEAVELAKLRGLTAELKALSRIVADKDAQKELAGLAIAAQAREEDAREATASGEASKSLFGTLQVINHTGEDLRIYVDGRYVGYAHNGHTENFHVHAGGHHNHFDAYCAKEGELVKHANYAGHAHFLRWHLDP